ncbi:MAG: TonB-dependent receptor, partial [Flavobacteriaceae bacterium]
GDLQYEIQVTDNENNPIETEVALSITRLGKEQQDNDEIQASFNEFELFPPFKGKAELSSMDQDRKERFISDIRLLASAPDLKRDIFSELEEETSIKYPFQDGLELVGYAYDMENNLLVSTPIQVMAFTIGEIWVQDLQTDSKGRLFLKNLQLHGNSDLVFRTVGEETQTRLVRVIPATIQNKQDSEALVKTKIANEKKRVFEPSAFETQDTTGLIKLKEVVVKKKAPEKISTPSLYNIEPSRIQYQNPERPKTLPELLLNIPGVVVRGIGTLTPSVSLPKSAGAGPILWVLDGFPINQTIGGLGIAGSNPFVEVISMVPATDVERIELLMGPAAAIYGTRGAGGVFLIYTRTGSDLNGTKRKEAQLAFQGYEPEIEFKDYLEERSKKAREASIILYWNPSIQTDENGKAIVRFAKPETDRPFKMQLSTITPDGKIGLYEGSLTDHRSVETGGN